MSSLRLACYTPGGHTKGDCDEDLNEHGKAETPEFISFPALNPEILRSDPQSFFFFLTADFGEKWAFSTEKCGSPKGLFPPGINAIM